MILGTTYSHRQAKKLRLDEKAFDELLAFKFDVIRLCCYWDEIQPKRSTYDFSKTSNLIEKCQKANQDVVLTVGMKAPQWPEYYIPSWLAGKSMEELTPYVLEFVEKAIHELKDFSCIKYWQVENEAPDPSGPKKLSISFSILQQEVNLVRSLDKRPIILTLWGNEVKQRKFFPRIYEVADVIGLDLYYKVPIFKNIFWGPRSYPRAIKNIIQQSEKPIWITELQAEPWEYGNSFAKDVKPKTMNESILRQNFEKALKLNPAAILFWGYEYWYLKKIQGEEKLWNCIKEICTPNVSELEPDS